MPEKIWTEDKISELRRLASKMTVKELSNHYGYTEDTIRSYLSRFGIKAKKRTELSTEEIAIVKELSQNLSAQKIAGIFDISTENMVKLMNNNGIPYYLEIIEWTDEKVEKLRTLAKSMTILDIADEFDTMYDSIERKMELSNIPHIVLHKNWTQEELDETRALADTLSVSELAKHFFTNYETMRAILIYYNIPFKAAPQRPEWTKERIEELRTLAIQMTPRELAAHYQVKIGTMRCILSRFGIKAKLDVIGRPTIKESIEILEEKRDILLARREAAKQKSHKTNNL